MNFRWMGLNNNGLKVRPKKLRYNKSKMHKQTECIKSKGYTSSVV